MGLSFPPQPIWISIHNTSGEGNGNPPQYPCLENPMDRGACGATVHRVARVRHDWVAEHACTWNINTRLPRRSPPGLRPLELGLLLGDWSHHQHPLADDFPQGSFMLFQMSCTLSEKVLKGKETKLHHKFSRHVILSLQKKEKLSKEKGERGALLNTLPSHGKK